MSGELGNVIRIDDLHAPRLDAGQQAALDYVASLDLDLAEERLLDEARGRAQRDDFGDVGFLLRLRAMIDAVEADTGLGPLGRLAIRQRTVRLLTSRLLVEDLVRRRPEILEIELVAPIIVIGLPRSGTTHLVNLIASDARLRSLPYWESLEPVPLPGDGPTRDGIDPRFTRCRRDYDAQMRTVPLLSAMHHRQPTAIEEEIELEDLDFASYTLEWLARVPRWRDVYLGLDQRSHYAYMKKVLQVVTFLRGPNRWVLKSPQHLEQIPALLATFPDAAFAITHRDPVSVIQSAATMLAYGDRMRRPAIEPEALVEYWIDRVDRLLRTCVRDRDLLPADRSIDVVFHEFMADDAGMVDRIYERADLPMTQAARQRLDAFMTENPRGKFGRLRYDLRTDFGLDPAAVRARFGYYFDRFPVAVEEA
ncbi:MAG: sulfotransferase [Actinomycetota bacterium]|nr:sulfotransferase [Actinomycetota bacterium]